MLKINGSAFIKNIKNVNGFLSADVHSFRKYKEEFVISFFNNVAFFGEAAHKLSGVKPSGDKIKIKLLDFTVKNELRTNKAGEQVTYLGVNILDFELVSGGVVSTNNAGSTTKQELTDDDLPF